MSQTTLAAGDMIVLGIDAVNDKITFATLVDISAGTTIKITDRGWDQTTNKFTTLMTGDGIVTWTTTAAISAGTVLTLTLGGNDNNPVNNLTNITANNTNLTNSISLSGYTVADPIGIAGDQVFIYQGADSNPYFIFGLNNSGGTNIDVNGWNTGTGFITLRDSQLPNGTGSQNALINGVNAIAMPGGNNQKDVVGYTGPVTASDAETWLSQITNVNHWTGDNESVTSTITTTGGSKVDIGAGVTVPTVTTTTASAITASSAALGGNVTADGGATITERGIVWATTASPTTANNKVAMGSGTGIFSQTVGSLPSGTIIYYRAYATNSVGTSYGDEGIMETFAGGTGTTANPYQIGTWGQLNNIRLGLMSHYQLVNTLDKNSSGYAAHASTTANSNVGWLPLGNDSQRFSATFDGNGYEINDLTINTNQTFVGLFGAISSAAIVENLGMNQVSIINGGSNTGAIVGRSYGTIRYVYVNGSVTGDNDLGLIAGYLSGGTIAYAYVVGTATSTGSGDDRVGGIAGSMVSSAALQHNYAAVQVSSAINVLTSATVANRVSGTVTAVYWDHEVSGPVTRNWGTGLTTAEMKSKSAYVDWDFTSTWDMKEGEYISYPYLRGVAQDPAPGLVFSPINTLSFNGIDQYVNVPNNTLLETANGTIEMWVKPGWNIRSSITDPNPTLISMRVGGDSRYSFHMGGTYDRIGLYSSNGGWQHIPYFFQKDTWYHIAFTYTSSVTKVYINGEFKGNVASLIAPAVTGKDLKIGSSDVSIPEFFKGELDEIRIWNKALTAPEILENMNQGINPEHPDLIAYYPVDADVLDNSNATARIFKDHGSNGLDGTLINYWKIIPDNGILYVKKGGAGNLSGDSWDNAIPELADALRWARQQWGEDGSGAGWNAGNPLQIWVAKGTYKPMYSVVDGAYDVDGGADNAFVLVPFVQLYGGFAGTESSLDDRNRGSNETILSGDLDNSNNLSVGDAYHVLAGVSWYGKIINEQVIVDGFTVSGGYAVGNQAPSVNGYSLSQNSGGGLSLIASSPKISYVVFENNQAFNGGAVSNYNNASPGFENVSMINNTAGGTGGGIFNAVNCSPVLMGVEIRDNTAVTQGGGLANVNSSPKLTNVLLADNDGGNFGGGIYNYASSPVLTNVTISDNAVVTNGGGIYSEGTGIVALQNSIIWGNTIGGNATPASASIFNNGAGAQSNIAYSLVANHGGGGSVLDTDPQFTNADLGDYMLTVTSPAVNAGNNALFIGLATDTKDLAGNDRVYKYSNDGIIDLGAYELQADPVILVTSVAVPANATYGIGQTLTFTVTFNQPVTVDETDGTPSIPLTIGTETGQATYSGGTGTTTLTFSYTVQPGDQASSGIILGTDVVLNGGDMGTAQLTLNGVPSTTGILVDGGSAPQFTSTPTLTTPYGQFYNYTITATGDETLPTTFTAEVLPDWLDLSTNDQSQAEAFGDIPPGKSIKGVAGDDQGNTYATTPNGSEIYKIAPDGTTTLWKSSSYGGDIFALHIADGYMYIPRLGNSSYSITRVPLADPASPEEIFATNDNGATSLTDHGDSIYVADFDGNKIYRVHKTTKEKDDVLTGLHGGPFGLTFGADGDLYIAMRNGRSIMRYNGTTLTEVLTELPSPGGSIRQDKQGNFYISMAGGGVRKYKADFTSFVSVSETDIDQVVSLSLTPNGYLVYSLYDTNQIYRLQTGAAASGTPDKSQLGSHPVTIRATNAVGSTNQSFTIQVVDQTAPVISSTTPTNNATEVALQPTLSITFDEEVELGEAGTLQLMDGATVFKTYDLSIPVDRAAFTLSTDKKTLTWTLTEDLPIYTNIAVEISAGFVKDLVDNDFAGITAASGAWNFTTRDRTMVTSVSVPANGTYGIGTTLTFTVNYAAAVTVDETNGTPSLPLTIGTASRQAAYKDGSGTAALTFSYTIQAGDLDGDGIALGTAIVLNGGDMGLASADLNSVGSTVEVLVDGIAPAAPSAPDLSPSSDSGASNTDNITNITTPTFTGTAEAGATVTLYDTDGTTVLGTGVATGGNWSITSSVLVEGPHNLTAKARDSAGNVGPASGSLAITIDVTAPAVPTNLTATFGDTKNVLNWTANGENDLALYKVSGGTATSPTTLLETVTAPATTYTHTGLTNGTTYYYRITAVDQAGNESTYGNEASATPKAPQVITFGALSAKTYGDEDFAPGATSTNNSIAITYTSSNEAVATIVDNKVRIIGSGTTTIKASQAAGAAYTAAADVSQELTVNKATLTVVPNTGQSKVYGEDDPTLTYTPTGFKLTDTQSILTGALSRATGENVNTYAINQGTLSAGSNYTISFTTGRTFAITPATLTVVPNTGQSKVYGDSDPTLAYTPTGFKLTDTQSILTGALSRATGESVNTYAINQGTLSAGSNYTISFTTGRTFAITPATLTVAPNTGQSKVYGDSDPTLTYTPTGFKLTDTQSILTGALSRTTGENVNTYAINQGTLSAGGNYTVSFTAGRTFAITPATLTVAPNTGQSKVYGDNDPTLTYTPTGFKLTDTQSILTGALSRAAGENVNTYAINQGTLSAGNNYTISFTTGRTFAITPATLTVTANANQSKVYGDSDPTLAYTPTGFKLTDTQSILTGALSRTTGENVNTYAITQGTLSAGSNYTITFTAGRTFAITPATLTVTANTGQSKVYGNSDPTLTYTPTGFKRTDTQSILTGALARAAGEDAGIYAINQGNLSAGANYNISFTGANFEIQKAPQTISFVSPGTLTRDAGTIDLDVEASSGLPVALTIDDEIIATVNSTALTMTVKRLGTVILTATQEGNHNYLPAEPVSVTVRIANDANARLPIRVHQAVSPNGDGINEFLQLEGIRDYPENKVTIFDKSGKVLAEIESYDNRDNVFTGQTVRDGIYYYYLDIKDGGEWKREKGYFVVRRKY